MTNPPRRTAGDAEDQTLRVAVPIPFRIVGLRRVAYGSKSAEFSIETPIGVVFADLFTPAGREPFVRPRSVREKYTGEWRRTVLLDRDFHARVLDAVRVELAQRYETSAEQQTQTAEPSQVLSGGERRFDAAFADFGASEGAS